MRAAVLEDLDRLVVKEVPDPQIGPGEVLVRVRACAVCGSDVRIYHHGNPRVKPPQILGHEIAGDVVAVGAGVEKFKVGDRIATAADVPCGVCEFCRNGMGNNCAINYALGYQFQGGFAELLPLNQITVNYGPVHHIPDGMSYETAQLPQARRKRPHHRRGAGRNPARRGGAGAGRDVGDPGAALAAAPGVGQEIPRGRLYRDR
jgi:L-iditol 2-dehydrogenase